MKRNDIILIIAVFIIALSGFITVYIIQGRTALEGGIAVVSKDNQEVMHIFLSDGSYEIIDETYIFRPQEDEVNPLFQQCFNEPNIYCVLGALGVVVIEYQNNQVRVIEETSPHNICQLQGFTNSPARPVTCLPNYVVIRVIALEEDDIDVYS